jgi:hypothetical protein
MAPSKKKPAIKLQGTVEKIIPPLGKDEPEKAEISVESADPIPRDSCRK